jgi:pSer/pThr/pTyr-binding forkhead associated (FHA) protein
MPEFGLEVGVACGRCHAFSRFGTAQCPRCSHALSLDAHPTSVDKDRSQAPEIVGGSQGHDQAFTVRPVDLGAQRPQETLMDQARYFVCESCMTPVPSGHKFCGRCGAAVPDHVMHLESHFYSDMQDPSKARLILIRGDGMDGLSYHLKADQHLVGRQGQVEFPDDPFVSPRHANFFYRDARLVVRDEGSLNGVYFRVRGSVELAPGDLFLTGEQVFRLDPTPRASDGADPDGTFFYSSPKYPSAFRVNQVLEGGSIGMTVCARGNTLSIGREDGDLNFPGDIFMSGKHAAVEEKDGHYTLTDFDTKNGTYVRIKAEMPLSHGDYVFVGRRLLRVEMNVN